MNGHQAAIIDGRFVDAYDLTLTGVADDAVREELRLLCHYETSDGRTYRVSQRDLMRVCLALAKRFGEDQPRSDGSFWNERRVYAFTPLAEDDMLDEGGDEI